MASKAKEIKYNRIKAVLAEKGMTGKELAAKLGVAPVTVSTWCRNFQQPTMDKLFKVALCLKVEPAELINTLRGSGIK